MVRSRNALKASVRSPEVAPDDGFIDTLCDTFCGADVRSTVVLRSGGGVQRSATVFELFVEVSVFVVQLSVPDAVAGAVTLPSPEVPEYGVVLFVNAADVTVVSACFESTVEYTSTRILLLPAAVDLCALEPSAAAAIGVTSLIA